MNGLIADIGGTNARFALVGDDGVPFAAKVLACEDYPRLVDAWRAYLQGTDSVDRPKRAAIAIASPVVGDVITMTNHVWSFSIAETRRELGLDALTVINDFVANALAVPTLDADHVRPVGGGSAVAGAPIVVLGPGTGLGLATLIANPAGGWLPIAGEGGHVTMAAADDMETAVLSLLRQRIGHVSAERVVSGPGLVNLYRTLADLRGRDPDPAITPEACSARASEGSCPISGEAVAMFCAMLGTVAGNAVLTVGGRGGVYIAGGIVPKLGDVFTQSAFRRRFEDKGRFRDYLAAVPTSVMEVENPALRGLASLVTAKGEMNVG